MYYSVEFPVGSSQILKGLRWHDVDITVNVFHILAD
jgi:hypothetical protein